MDRYTTNIAGAQGGFIDNFIRPAFELLTQILPETKVNIEQMEENKLQWKALEDDYDPKYKYTQKEIEGNSVSSSHQVDGQEEENEDLFEESEEDDLDISVDDEQSRLRDSTQRPSKSSKYTINSNSEKKRNSVSTL